MACLAAMAVILEACAKLTNTEGLLPCPYPVSKCHLALLTRQWPYTGSQELAWPLQLQPEQVPR
jgi:hypothetical protein